MIIPVHVISPRTARVYWQDAGARYATRGDQGVVTQPKSDKPYDLPSPLDLPPSGVPQLETGRPAGSAG